MKVDFDKFRNSLPYASELYGIYQPLLGWRSRVRTLELAEGVDLLRRGYLQELQLNTRPRYKLPEPGVPRDVPAGRFQISIGERAGLGRTGLDAVDSHVARRVGELVAAAGFAGDAWRKYTSAEELEEILAGAGTPSRRK